MSLKESPLIGEIVIFFFTVLIPGLDFPGFRNRKVIRLGVSL